MIHAFAMRPNRSVYAGHASIQAYHQVLLVPLSYRAVDESLIYPLPGRAWLDVNVANLQHNAMTLQRCSGARLIPMVKANAYGVGVRGAIAALEPLSPLAYGVSSVAEGEELRQLGVDREVIIFTPILEAEYGRAAVARLVPTLGDEAAIAAWSATGLPYHLSVDTGMNRAGTPWREAALVRDAVLEWPPAGVFTHFHSSELANGSAEEQARRLFAALGEIGSAIPLVHTSNSSAAALGVARSEAQAIRPGIFLYGAGPSHGLPMKPVVSLRARVVDIRWVEAGDSVSYDATYVAPARARIATAAAGYGDGYPRACSDRAWGMIEGQRAAQRGLVTMDMTMFDVTDIDCAVGDTVTLIGAEEQGGLTVDGLATLAGMSPYELLTGLSTRLERRFIEA